MLLHKFLIFLVTQLVLTCCYTNFDWNLSSVKAEHFAINLQGQWQLNNKNGSVSLSGTVPGNVLTDLLNAGKISDPYYRYNDVNYRWIASDNWIYTRTFSIDSSVATFKKLLLVCEGIDTISTIKINSKIIGSTNNMFRRWVFDITNSVNIGTNTITVEFQSAFAYANSKSKEYPYDVTDGGNPPEQHGEPHRNFIRKEQCSFSWDWGPCFAPIGIWQPIGIVAFSDAIINYVTPDIYTTDPGSSIFTIKVTTYVTSAIDTTLTVDISVAGFTGTTTSYVTMGDNAIVTIITVSNVKLWWPVGYGEPNLYTLQTNLKNNQGNIIRSDTRSVGFRSVEIVTDKISGQNGTTFYFRVNKVPIYAKGANWIPVDSFENRVTYDDLRQLILSSKNANMNMVRVWGGGIYQHDAFYSICDELGLLVWEEFMFACAMYPRDKAFLKNVEEEISHQVKRLMHHPSIVLWSGNNENEAALGWYTETIQHRDLYIIDYSKLYYDTVFATVAEYDTGRPLWPSSPSNGFLVNDPLVGIWGNPYDFTQGDLHFYNYEMMCTNISNLPSPRFASEYGFQSFPSIATWTPVTETSDWNANSPLMNHRQHHPDGTKQITDQIKMHFPLKTGSNATANFENFIYLSQCVQALCIGFESEHYRRSKGMEANTMGALYWQLNDIWQAPTWSSLEYGGRWKLLHYFAKRFFAPMLISSYESPDQKFYYVHVTSDLTTSISGTTELSLWSWQGQKLRTWKVSYNLSPLESKQIYQDSISKMIAGYCTKRSDCVIVLDCYDTNNQKIATNVYYLSNLAESPLVQPNIRVVQINQTSSTTATVLIQSDGVAAYVTLSTPLQGYFSDNGLLLLPGQGVTLTFTGESSFTTAQLSASLTIKSIRDTY